MHDISLQKVFKYRCNKICKTMHRHECRRRCLGPVVVVAVPENQRQRAQKEAEGIRGKSLSLVGARHQSTIPRGTLRSRNPQALLQQRSLYTRLVRYPFEGLHVIQSWISSTRAPNLFRVKAHPISRYFVVALSSLCNLTEFVQSRNARISAWIYASMQYRKSDTRDESVN